MKICYAHLIMPVLVLLLTACATPHTIKEPTIQQALAAPSADLAHSYLSVKLITKTIPSPEGGSTLQLGDKTITSSNAEEYRLKYNKRLSTYGEALKQRGYMTVSGSYRSKTSESCARIQSSWVGLLNKASAHVIELVQDVEA